MRLASVVGNVLLNNEFKRPRSKEALVLLLQRKEELKKKIGRISNYLTFPTFLRYPATTHSINYKTNLEDILVGLQNIEFTNHRDLTTNLRHYLDKVYQSEEEMLNCDDDDYFYHDYYYKDIDIV